MIRGRHFEDRQALENEVRRICFREIKMEEYRKAMEDLIRRWQKCVSVRGYYVEKVSIVSDNYL